MLGSLMPIYSSMAWDQISSHQVVVGGEMLLVLYERGELSLMVKVLKESECILLRKVSRDLQKILHLLFTCVLIGT